MGSTHHCNTCLFLCSRHVPPTRAPGTFRPLASWKSHSHFSSLLPVWKHELTHVTRYLNCLLLLDRTTHHRIAKVIRTHHGESILLFRLCRLPHNVPIDRPLDRSLEQG